MGSKKRLPQMAGGSASALSLSRPAQASLTLRPAGSLSRPRRPLSRGSSPRGCPHEPLVSYRINRQLSGWKSSSTSDARLRGALPATDIGWLSRTPRRTTCGRSIREEREMRSGQATGGYSAARLSASYRCDRHRGHRSLFVARSRADSGGTPGEVEGRSKDRQEASSNLQVDSQGPVLQPTRVSVESRAETWA